ncbi:hypothetical protein P378_19265 [Desulforamulus profundi]|uniref:Small integral membrane protein n=1 Tax=Desulforamulus profundi TaxID=1383067 RepID=A0A2C6MBS2_9FIRM|nr:DUF2273 domain-containing protein [Desulforamulus profundi]MCL4441083.1 DUF2273 domain-containing protein [Bacillota bacterium]MCL5779975.1 DUF2273 domain-containing protein [Bacillota bacterium]PHJ36955.1 hypothetical protein P378_19265 [Desulforamulus profundi]
MFIKFMQEILENHQGKAMGVILGLLFGWFAVSYGFFKAVFVAFCVTAGYFIGKGVDEHFDFRGAFDRLFRDRW